jgi:hypothetical protein
VVDIEPVNLLYGNVDTNTFDTNVVLMPVFLEALGIDPAAESARISYFVGVAGYYSPPGELVDFVPSVLSFDPLNPGVVAEDAGGPSLLTVAQPGTSLTIRTDAAALEADGANSLLVLSYHNATGERAQVVKLRP